ncbi:MAG: V-type ATP synthase subunit C [Clostridiaceae bacterium]
MDFNQAVMRIKVLEKRLLAKSRLERMVEASDINEVIKILGETEYQYSLGLALAPAEYEKILSGEMRRVYRLMDELTGEQAISKLLSLKYDYHNLKVLLKEKFLGTDLSRLYISYGSEDFSRVKNAYLSENFEGIDEKIVEALKAASEDFELTRDPQRIDIIIDRYYFEHLLHLAKSTEIPLFEDYVKDTIDFTNMRTLIRVKKMDKDQNFLDQVILDGGNISKEKIYFALKSSLEEIMETFKDEKIGKELVKGIEAFKKTGNLNDYEKIMDNSLMKLHEPSKTTIFGPEPLFSYLYAKEAEIKALRIIMVSKMNQLSPETIRERLRDLYV